MLVYQRVSPIFRQTYIAQTGQRSALLRAHKIPTAFKVLSPDSLQSRDLLHGTRPMTGWKYEHGNHGHRVIEWMETYGNPVIRWTNGMKLQPLDGNPEGGTSAGQRVSEQRLWFFKHVVVMRLIPSCFNFSWEEAKAGSVPIVPVKIDGPKILCCLIIIVSESIKIPGLCGTSTLW